MDPENVFRQENIGLIFRPEEGRGDFIAEAHDGFSDYMNRQDFGREWAWRFLPASLASCGDGISML